MGLVMSLHERWTYEQDDPAIMLFTAALKAWQLPILHGQSVLEIGCNESDFLPRLAKADPTLKLTGMDWRPLQRPDGHGPEGFTFVQGCAWDADLFPAESFDWVLLLGALEHFGLGYYGDPKDENGDQLTMKAVMRWLKPGGQVYFDVPCNPQSAQTSHFRTYAPRDLWCRLIVMNERGTASVVTEVSRGYSLPEPHAGTWVPMPTIHRVPYHFVAVWARKVGDASHA